MKKYFLLLSLLWIVSACAPSIEKVETMSAQTVENALTEDNTDSKSLHLIRYCLSERVDALTYKGFLKAKYVYTNFYPYALCYGKDSTNVMFDVEVKFRDRKYKCFVVSLQPRQ